ncbi:MAG: hypothetical protein QNJ54_20600 [Prochloraceae cyanobacterium]|nr:hypothetical protein [Prochloraceae cyanobacterium]
MAILAPRYGDPFGIAIGLISWSLAGAQALLQAVRQLASFW